MSGYKLKVRYELNQAKKGLIAYATNVASDQPAQLQWGKFWEVLRFFSIGKQPLFETLCSIE